MSTEQQHATAVLTALNAALTTGMDAYDYDDIPGTLPDNYVEVTVTRRAGAPNRGTGSTGRSGWRITTRPVAKFISNAREMRRLTSSALLFVRLSVDGDLTSPIQFEGEEPIGPDEGRYSGLTTWSYGI